MKLQTIEYYNIEEDVLYKNIYEIHDTFNNRVIRTNTKTRIIKWFDEDQTLHISIDDINRCVFNESTFLTVYKIRKVDQDED